MKLTKMAFERRYSDSSIEFAVRFNLTACEVEIEHDVNVVTIPLTELDWLIEALRALRRIQIEYDDS